MNVARDLDKVAPDNRPGGKEILNIIMSSVAGAGADVIH